MCAKYAASYQAVLRQQETVKLTYEQVGCLRGEPDALASGGHVSL